MTGSAALPPQRQTATMANAATTMIIVSSTNIMMRSVFSAWKKAGLALLAIAMVVTVFNPALTTWVAQLMGVGRGADLLLYGVTGAFVIYAILQYIARQKEHDRMIRLARRVAAATVSLAALGQRAFALPGLVRQAFSRGLDRADLAVQDAFDRWHGQVGQKVDDLRQAARDKVQGAADAVRGRASDISSAVSGKVGEISDNIRHTADAISQTAAGVVHDVKEDVRFTVSQVKDAAQDTADGIMAFDRVASSRLRSFWNETVAPAFQRFSQELTEEFHSQRSSRSRINAEYAQMEGNSAEAPAPAASTPPKMN